jgi:hypothetical protein
MKICCLVTILGMSVPAYAQAPIAGDASRPRLIISERAIAAALAAAPPAQSRQSRDSVANGALIGGLLAGVGMAGTGLYVCSALKEPGDPSCWPGVLTVGAISFVVGAAVGAGLDALFTRLPSQPQPKRLSPTPVP